MNIGSFLSRLFSKDLAIDFGTANTLIYLQGNGVVLYEPSIVAYDTADRKILAVGEEAQAMRGKTPQVMEVRRPLSGGVITDFYLGSELLKRLIEKICKRSFIKPRVMICVPSTITGVEQSALIDACHQAGARKVYLIEEPIAAAVGAGCDISLARGMLIADIGSGTTDIAAISLGNPVVSRSIKTAGEEFTEAVVSYVRQKYNLIIGTPTAERIKMEIGCVFPRERLLYATACGSDAATGMPRSVTLNSDELREAFDPAVNAIVQVIKSALEDTPPALLNDILEDGILLTGGGAKLYGLEKRLKMETGIKIFLAQDMDLCVIKGAGIALESLGKNIDAAHTYYKN